MKVLDINLERRNEKGKENAKKLRRKGFIPAVFYQKGGENFLLQISTKEFEKLIKHKHTEGLLVKFSLDGSTYTAVIQEVQKNNLGNEIMHLDFKGVSMTEKSIFKVPLVLTGSPDTSKGKGVIEQHLKEIEIRCYPADLPEEIMVDISNLLLDEALEVKDLKVDPALEIVTSPEEIIAIYLPVMEERPQVVEEEAVVEEVSKEAREETEK